MVTSYETDEEAIDAIKKWWRENGSSTVIVIVLAIAAVVGWQTWQSNRAESAATASGLYQQLLDSAATDELSAEQLSTAKQLSEQLVNEHGSSTYAVFSRLLLAKLYVDKDDLGAAREQLQSVLDSRPKPDLESLTRLRLAKVVFAETGAKEAMAVINNVEAGAYRMAYAELRGDLNQELGDFSAAVDEYGLALEGSDDRQEGNALIKRKLKQVQLLEQNQTRPSPSPELPTNPKKSAE